MKIFLFCALKRAFTCSNIALNEVSPSPFRCLTLVFRLVNPNSNILIYLILIA